MERHVLPLIHLPILWLRMSRPGWRGSLCGGNRAERRGICGSASLAPPSHLKTIETGALEGIAAEAIIIPDGCTAIASKAFINCKNLLYVRIPAGITIPDDAFDGCPNVMIDQK